MNKIYKIAMVLLINFLALTQIVAGDDPPSEKVSPESPFLQNVVGEINGVSEKLTGLAGAFSDDQYSWRPAEGVRSVSESFIHASLANYFIFSLFGHPMPEGVNREMEKSVTKKEEVIEWVKKSYAYAADMAAKVDAATLEDEFETPFGKLTKRKLLFIVVGHGHEHMGQMIAYARMNGVVPPWSGHQGEE